MQLKSNKNEKLLNPSTKKMKPLVEKKKLPFLVHNSQEVGFRLFLLIMSHNLRELR